MAEHFLSNLPYLIIILFLIAVVAGIRALVGLSNGPNSLRRGHKRKLALLCVLAVTSSVGFVEAFKLNRTEPAVWIRAKWNRRKLPSQLRGYRDYLLRFPRAPHSAAARAALARLESGTIHNLKAKQTPLAGLYAALHQEKRFPRSLVVENTGTRNYGKCRKDLYDGRLDSFQEDLVHQVDRSLGGFWAQMAVDIRGHAYTLQTPDNIFNLRALPKLPPPRRLSPTLAIDYDAEPDGTYQVTTTSQSGSISWYEFDSISLQMDWTLRLPAQDRVFRGFMGPFTAPSQPNWSGSKWAEQVVCDFVTQDALSTLKKQLTDPHAKAQRLRQNN